MREARRVLFLFSDTGGGHRSAAEATADALSRNYPNRYQVELVDVLKDYAPRPLNWLPRAYPSMARSPRAWALGYWILDGHRRAQTLTASLWFYVRSAARRLIEQQAPDLLASFHPLLIAPVLKALGWPRPPFLTVVTDLVTTHALWFHRQVDRCLVPTERARQRALACGLRPDQVQVLGLPVGRRFCHPIANRDRLRADLGWPTDRPMVLLVGGSEGMGPVFETARAIDSGGTGIGLAVVAGRNAQLRRELEDQTWAVPTFVYGFEHRMPEMMQAATLLVTKAGPGTITEALNAGLPMVLYSRLPGQEDGNVSHVVDQGVGVWAPGPKRTAKAVFTWLSHPEEISRASSVCRRIARPDAADKVAALLNAYLIPLPSLEGLQSQPSAAVY